MVEEDYFERATIEEIKSSKWFNGPIYSPEELKAYMSKKYYENSA